MRLVDTSIWVEVLRSRSRRRLEDFVDPDEAVTCAPVIQEVLQGAREESAYRAARSSLLALPIVEDPLAVAVFEEAAALYRLARRQGVTIRAPHDCLIAAIAVRNDLEILHRDRDYPLLAKVSPLRQREV